MFDNFADILMRQNKLWKSPNFAENIQTSQLNRIFTILVDNFCWNSTTYQFVSFLSQT
jgi:hypothetical protein